MGACNRGRSPRRCRRRSVYNIGGFNERRNIDIVRRLIDTVRRLVESDARYRELAAISPEKMDYNPDKLCGRPCGP